MPIIPRLGALTPMPTTRGGESAWIRSARSCPTGSALMTRRAPGLWAPTTAQTMARSIALLRSTATIGRRSTRHRAGLHAGGIAANWVIAAGANVCKERLRNGHKQRHASFEGPADLQLETTPNQRQRTVTNAGFERAPRLGAG